MGNVLGGLQGPAFSAHVQDGPCCPLTLCPGKKEARGRIGPRLSALGKVAAGSGSLGLS